MTEKSSMKSLNEMTQKKIQRGALQVVVEPSTKTIAAGENFSIAVRITNPFEVPIQIKNVATILPFALYDVVLAKKLEEKRQAEKHLENVRNDLIRELGGKSTSNFMPLLGDRITSTLISLVPMAGVITQVTANAVAVTYGAKFIYSSDINKFIKSAKNLLEKTRGTKSEALSNEEIQNKVENLMKPLTDELESFTANVDQSSILQAGNSISTVFNLRTKKGITFKPNSYNLDISISYEVDGIDQIQSIPYALGIQASLHSVILGAIIGSIFGVLANNPNILIWDWKVIIPVLISSLIFSGFAVIAFARKEGVQPVIAVQDLWGGLLIGFLVGYSGIQVFGNLLGGVQNN